MTKIKALKKITGIIFDLLKKFNGQTAKLTVEFW